MSFRLARSLGASGEGKTSIMLWSILTARSSLSLLKKPSQDYISTLSLCINHLHWMFCHTLSIYNPRRLGYSARILVIATWKFFTKVRIQFVILHFIYYLSEWPSRSFKDINVTLTEKKKDRELLSYMTVPKWKGFSIIFSFPMLLPTQSARLPLSGVSLFELDHPISKPNCSPKRSSKGHPSWFQCYYRRNLEYPSKICNVW